MIRGVILPVTGRVPILAGDTVAVAWRQGKMDVVLFNQARRSGGAALLPVPSLGVVEELFYVNDEVWFRNGDQFRPLSFVDAEVPMVFGFVDPSVVWGRGHADFFVIVGQIAGGTKTAMAVYRVNRPRENEPFPPNFRIRARLVQFYNLTDDPTIFGTMTVSATNAPMTQTGTAMTDIRYEAVASLPSGAGPTDPPWPIQIQSTPAFAGVAPNGDLLVVITIAASAPVGQVGVTDAVFAVGTLLVNVTKAEILANHLADTLTSSIYVTPNSTFVCTLLGTSTASTSIGLTPTAAGVITLLSLKLEDPNDPNTRGTFNNYLVRRPATVFVEAVRVESPPGVPIGEIFCNPTRPDLTLSVIGEFNEENVDFAVFPGSPLGPVAAQVPRVQASRSLVISIPFTERGIQAGPVGMRDLRRGVTSTVKNSMGVQIDTLKVITTSAASLLYVPDDPTPPHHRQFFAAGHNRRNGEITLDLLALRRDPALLDVGALARARTPAQRDIAAAIIDRRSIQVMDSEEQLGAAFQPGPL